MKNKPAEEADHEAEIARLIDLYWAGVYAVLYRLLGDAAEAEDLTLETFWRYYQQKPPDQSRQGGWFYRVASNLGLNALRSRRRRETRERNLAVEEATLGKTSNPEQDVELLQEKRQVRDVLAQMKPQQAQLLLLRYSGLKYAELAEALQLNPKSVGKLLARAEAEFARRFRQQNERD
jgi:RNA polymerase sigma-70 factor (ECF subfamily)